MKSLVFAEPPRSDAVSRCLRSPHQRGVLLFGNPVVVERLVVAAGPTPREESPILTGGLRSMLNRTTVPRRRPDPLAWILSKMASVSGIFGVWLHHRRNR